MKEKVAQKFEWLVINFPSTSYLFGIIVAVTSFFYGYITGKWGVIILLTLIPVIIICLLIRDIRRYLKKRKSK